MGGKREAGGTVLRHLSNLYEVRCDFGKMNDFVWSVVSLAVVYVIVSLVVVYVGAADVVYSVVVVDFSVNEE